MNRGHREISSTSQVGQAHRPASICQVLQEVEHSVHRLHPCGYHDASIPVSIMRNKYRSWYFSISRFSRLTRSDGVC